MKSLKYNFMMNILNQLLSIIVPLLTTPYLSRILGAKQLGAFSYANSITYYFTLFGMLGLANYGSREIAKCRNNSVEMSRVFSGIYTVQLLCASTVSFIYMIYINVNHDALAMVMFLHVVSVLLDINWFYYGLENFDRILYRNIIVKLMTMIAIFVLVKKPSDVVIYALITSIGSFLGNILLWGMVHKKIHYIRPTIAEIKRHFVANLTLFLPILILSVYKVMDKIMLKWMTSYEQVGYYENADKLGQIPLYMISALSQIMIPRISFFISKGKQTGVVDYLDKSLIFISFLSSSLIFGILGISKEFVPLYFGDGYESCIEIIEVLLPSYIFSGYANVFRSQMLIPYGRDKEFAKTLAVGAMLNLGINFLLIPHFQARGAAIATGCAEFAVFLMTYLYVRRSINLCSLLKKNVIFYISGFVMLVVLRVIPTIGGAIFNLFIRITIGAVVYLVTLIAIFYLKERRNEKNSY